MDAVPTPRGVLPRFQEEHAAAEPNSTQELIEAAVKNVLAQQQQQQQQQQQRRFHREHIPEHYHEDREEEERNKKARIDAQDYQPSGNSDVREELVLLTRRLNDLQQVLSGDRRENAATSGSAGGFRNQLGSAPSTSSNLHCHHPKMVPNASHDVFSSTPYQSRQASNQQPPFTTAEAVYPGHAPPSHHNYNSSGDYRFPPFDHRYHDDVNNSRGSYLQRERSRERRGRWDQYGRVLANIDRFHRSQDWADETNTQEH